MSVLSDAASFAVVAGLVTIIPGLDSNMVHTIMDRITGTVLIGFGVKLALSSR
jgi:threonine/homoserine/homoserine lactone efflux protein